MKRTTALIMTVILFLTLASCDEITNHNLLSNNSNVLASINDVDEWINSLDIDLNANNTSVENEQNGDETNMLYLKIGDITLTATLVDNLSTQALKELLAEKSITIEMSDYGGFEKVGGLGASLSTNDERITSEPGDLLLYQGNQFVIFYEPNTWSYTRIGKINDITQEELKKVLGNGDVNATLSLTQ